MGRQHRLYLPGGTFHLIARCQGREAFFSPELRTRFVTLLREQIAHSDAELFAYTVMPNHVHLVVRQGKRPLWRLMQPLLRRTALAVLRAFGREGHVFERRYRSHVCGTPDYFRNVVVYTHLNPVRAGLCTTPGEYPWSSHGAWVGDDVAADGRPQPVTITTAAQAFATAQDRTPAELAGDYLTYLEWRQECDRIREENAGTVDEFVPLPPGPPVARGDANWMCYLAPPSTVAVDGVSHLFDPGTARARRPDLTRIAATVVRASGHDLVPHFVRSRWGGSAYVRARRSIILQAAAAGYRCTEIAAFLRISPSAVSSVLTAERKRLLASKS